MVSSVTSYRIKMAFRRLLPLLGVLVIFALFSLLLTTVWTNGSATLVKTRLHLASFSSSLDFEDDNTNTLNQVSILENTVEHSSTSTLCDQDQLAKMLSADSDFPANINKLDQDDPLLHKYILLRHLTPPSKEPYNLPGSPSQMFANGYTHFIAKVFNNKQGGTFIEAGAYDGVAASNSLYFEKALGWKGLLVECNPMSIPFLKLKKRKAWVADVCLSETRYPGLLNFSNPTAWAPSAKIGKPRDLSKWGVKTDWTQFQVTALPLFGILSAVNLTQIDFFSLDIEGAEFEVLKNIPWGKVSISTLFVEVDHFPADVKENIKQFMQSKGYTLYQDFQSDHFYVHSSVTPGK